MTARCVFRRAGVVALALLVTLTGCAAFVKHRPAGVPIDKRPTPTTDGSGAIARPNSSGAAGSSGETTPAPAKPPAVESAMTREERTAMVQRIVADTTAAGLAVRKCGGKQLLPDQESVFDTARGLLTQTRVALAHDELWRAESLARKARQLAAVLHCP